MLTRSLITLSILTIRLASASAQDAPESMQCPLELPRPVQTVKETPPGFTTMPAVPYPVHELTGFRVNLGPPTHEDPAIYDDISTTNDAKGGTTERLSWRLAGLDDPYVVCLYRSTAQVLFRPLSGYKECSVVSKGRRGSVLKIESAVCK